MSSVRFIFFKVTKSSPALEAARFLVFGEAAGWEYSHYPVALIGIISFSILLSSASSATSSS